MSFRDGHDHTCGAYSIYLFFLYRSDEILDERIINNIMFK